MGIGLCKLPDLTCRSPTGVSPPLFTYCRCSSLLMAKPGGGATKPVEPPRSLIGWFVALISGPCRLAHWLADLWPLISEWWVIDVVILQYVHPLPPKLITIIFVFFHIVLEHTAKQIPLRYLAMYVSIYHGAMNNMWKLCYLYVLYFVYKPFVICLMLPLAANLSYHPACKFWFSKITQVRENKMKIFYFKT